MFRLFTKLDADLKPRIFFLCQDDLLAPMLVAEYCKTYAIDVVEQKVIPRPRKVGQSYFTSIFTTIWTILFCVWSLVCDPLDLILCNGPGICVCIGIGAHLASIVFIVFSLSLRKFLCNIGVLAEEIKNFVYRKFCSNKEFVLKWSINAIPC